MDSNKNVKVNSNFNKSFSEALPYNREELSPSKNNDKDLANTSLTEDMGGVYKSMKKSILTRFNRTTSQQDITSPRSDV